MKKLICLLFFTSLISCGGPENGGGSDGLDANEHRVFVSSQKYDGDMNGVSGADQECDRLARAAGLSSRDYKAIMGDDTDSALSRITIRGPIYRFKSATESEFVALNSSDFWSSSKDLLNSISYDEKYVQVTSNEDVWTGTSVTGGVTLNDNCNEWNSNSSSASSVGTAGRVGSVDLLWTDNGVQTCNETFRIYCISQ